MKKILFKAIDGNGNEITEYISAISSRHALNKLKKRGYKEIEFLHDALFSDEDNLYDLDEKNLKTLAKLEAKSIQNPSFLNDFLKFLTLNKTVLTLAIFFITVGVIWPSDILLGTGAFIAVFTTGYWLYSYRNVKLYDKIMREIAFGNYIEALELIKKLKKSSKRNNEIAMNLDLHKAKIVACKGHINYAFAILEDYKEALERKMPGQYYNYKAALFAQIKDYKNSIKYINKSFEENSGSVLITLDAALYNSMFGDIAYAKKLIDENVNFEEVPKYGKIIYYMALGNIYYAQKDFKNAKINYEKMMHSIEPFVENPVFWGIAAIAAGYYAVLLHDLKKNSEALELLKDGTVAILNVHADDFLRAKLHKRFPNLINKDPFCS